MGVISNIFKKIKIKMAGSLFGWYSSKNSPFSLEAWQQDTFRAAVDEVATRTAMGKIQHVIMKDGQIQKAKTNTDICRVLNIRANEIMTGYDFKYRLFAQLETKTTAVAYIKWRLDANNKEVKMEAIYPVDYTNYEFREVIGGGYAIQFTDYEGNITALPLENCIVLRKFYCDNEVSGDGNLPIYKVLDMNKASDEGFIEALTVSNKVRGLLKQRKAMLDPKDVEKGQDDFTARFKKAAEGGGIVGVDSMEDYLPLNVTAYSANAAQMDRVDGRIFTFLRTNKNMIQGDYSEAQGIAFHENRIQPIWEMFAQALTGAYFSAHEIECGNQILVSGGMLVGASIQSRVNVLNATKDTGELTTNERRELLGYPPIEDGDVRQISLNYVKSEDQSNYQTGNTDGEKEEENNAE